MVFLCLAAEPAHWGLPTTGVYAQVLAALALRGVL